MSKYVYGYCGYYKNLFLRSSYEYVFCKILEAQNISFKMEENKYLLPTGKYYIPDFFIYNKDKKLTEIIEIKSEAKSLKSKGLKNIKMLQEIVNVKCSIYFLKDLKSIAKNLNIDVNKLIDEWKELNTSKTRQVYSKSIRESIGETTKARMVNKKWKEYWKSQIKKSAINWSYKLEGERTKRIIKKCKFCNKEFKVMETSNKIYCSNVCCVNGTKEKSNKIKKK